MTVAGPVAGNRKIGSLRSDLQRWDALSTSRSDRCINGNRDNNRGRLLRVEPRGPLPLAYGSGPPGKVTALEACPGS